MGYRRNSDGSVIVGCLEDVIIAHQAEEVTAEAPSPAEEQKPVRKTAKRTVKK